MTKRTIVPVIAMLCCIMLFSGCLASSQPAVSSTPVATDVVAIDSATPAPATADVSKGLVLVVPVLTDNVKTIKNENNTDGTYREELLFDDLVGIVIERVKGVEATEQAITKKIDTLNADPASEVSIKKDDAISAKLSYPAWRITYKTGSNEDTRKNLDIYVQTDDWDFRFHTATPIDSFDEYSENIEAWIDSIDLFDGK